MASMNTTINAPIKRVAADQRGKTGVEGTYEFYNRNVHNRPLYLAEAENIEMDWGNDQVDVHNDTFGSSSIKKIIGEFARNNRGIKYLNQLELAQKLTRQPEDDFLKADIDEQTRQGHAEQEAIQNIITSSKRPNAQKIQKNHSKMDDLKNDAVVALREKLQKKYEDRMVQIHEEEKRLKNAKRNAKRKAKAKKTKKTLNYTPTKEEDEWFWGAAPHGGDERIDSCVSQLKCPVCACPGTRASDGSTMFGCDCEWGNASGFHDPTEYGSDGFPTEEEYERKELELGGAVIHCGGGRWKLG